MADNVKIDNTHVPDKVYAYTLQVRHMMYELLECGKEDAVSVEVIDDIGVEKKDGTVIAIQAKSALSKGNPVSNRAVDLWKSLSNWLEAINEGEIIIEKATYILLINTNKHGLIVDAFNDAETDEEAMKAWEKAREEFYDKDGKEKKLNEEYANYIRAFFLESNKLKACSIIKGFKLRIMSKNHIDVLYQKFEEKSCIAKEQLDLLFIYMLGWIDKKTAKLIENGKSMSIYGYEFRNELTAKYREVNQKLSLIEIAAKPSKDMIEGKINDSPVFVEQLDIIDCDYTDKVEAVSDYLRASANRVLWAKDGDISEDALLSFSEELSRTWNNKKKVIDITQRTLPDATRGKLLYFECKETEIDVGTLATPSFFTSGCFQELADDKSIGWHPNFKEILKERKCNNG